MTTNWRQQMTHVVIEPDTSSPGYFVLAYAHEQQLKCIGFCLTRWGARRKARRVLRGDYDPIETLYPESSHP